MLCSHVYDAFMGFRNAASRAHRDARPSGGGARARKRNRMIRRLCIYMDRDEKSFVGRQIVDTRQDSQNGGTPETTLYLYTVYLSNSISVYRIQYLYTVTINVQ